MEAGSSVDRFVAWFRGVNPASYQNEDDVETKFVLPFFQYLGYPEACRRGKYPISTYSPGKAGRKPEVDQAYFSSNEAEHQERDTCLLVVEAKEPNEVDLDKDVEQAQFYGYHLTPSFLVLTNGARLKVLRRRHFQSEEIVCDEEIKRLQEPERAVELFRMLNFDAVEAVKRDSLDQLSHARYVQLDESLQRYPDLVEVLNKGDFRPFKSSQGDQAICVEPKVAVTARLPAAMTWGSVEVEFSNITRRGLRIQLDHRRVLEELMLGLNTPLEWGMRPFIRRLDDNAFEVKLGDTTTVVGAEEGRQLCGCMDYTCSAYRKVIDETDTALRAGSYEPVLMEDRVSESWSYLLLRVELELWTAIKNFVEEFDWSRGHSEWHIFDAQHSSDVCVGRGIVEHAHLSPRPVISELSGLPVNCVDLLYTVEPYTIEAIQHRTNLDWTKSVGPKGIWSTTDTQKWVIEKLIPAVRRKYMPDQVQCTDDPYRDPGILELGSEDLYGARIESAASFIPCLDLIQSWLYGRGVPVPARLLHPYYRAFCALAKRLQKPFTNQQMLDYVIRRLEGAEGYRNGSMAASNDSLDSLYTTDRLLASLDRHVARTAHVRYEDSVRADWITRALLALLRNSTINCSQAELTVAKESLLPLWAECRFEQRYIPR